MPFARCLTTRNDGFHLAEGRRVTDNQHLVDHGMRSKSSDTVLKDGATAHNKQLLGDITAHTTAGAAGKDYRVIHGN